MSGIAMLGSGFIADFYMQTLYGQRHPDPVVTVQSRTPEHARAFAEKYHLQLLHLL